MPTMPRSHPPSLAPFSLGSRETSPSSYFSVLSMRRPVLSLCANALVDPAAVRCGSYSPLGQLQTDANYHRMLGVDRVTDPTTMGDFLRRFGRRDLNDAKEAIWAMRTRVWKKIGHRLGRHASLDLDNRVCPVYGDQKRGADRAVSFSRSRRFSGMWRGTSRTAFLLGRGPSEPLFASSELRTKQP